MLDLANVAAGLIVAVLDNIIPVLIFALLQLADVATTVSILRDGGREQNGFIAMLMDRLGYGWIVVKLAIACIAAGLILSSGAAWPLWLLILVYVWVVRHNWRQMRRWA